MKNITSILLFAVGIFWGGCKKSDDTELDTVSFSAQIAPFFDSNCTACHYGGRQEPDFRELYSYNSLTNGEYVVAGDDENSLLVQQLETGHPEEGVVSQTQLEMIKLWIDQGAKNN